MNLLEKKFLENVRRQNLAGKADAVLVTVSGGPDSMALLHLFAAVQPVLGCSLAVAHCNFRLRGEESDEDEAFVHDACRALGVACHTRGFDTRKLSVTMKRSIEETARLLRYDFFEELCRNYGYTRVATGHHAGDNVETMLFNLFRGTSPAGFRGIRAKHGPIVRPLLPYGRAELLSYLGERSIGWRTDRTNLDSDHDRNFIRNRVIPVVEERFATKLAPSLQRMSEHAGELDEFMELHVESLLREHPMLDLQGGRLHVVTLQKLTRFERKELLKRALQAQGVTADSNVLGRLSELLQQQPGRSVPVGRGVTVKKADGFLVFFRER
ncbi:MAG: tRNA lysidine(34) synthetase TilS [Chlorobiaceae bacterium]|nr:tRNA lysidine(34) synthetase TilS [Chlorobiaceae bacterium]